MSTVGTAHRAASRTSPIATSLIVLAAGALVIVGLAALLDVTLFTKPSARRAVQMSAVVAYAVQLAGFALLYSLRKWNVMAAWGLAALLRFLSLAAYALLALKTLRLQPAAALCSLVTFFFVTTLAEPWLIRS
jgi:hypothetical protein